MLDPKLLAVFSRILCFQGSEQLAKGLAPEAAVRSVWQRHTAKTSWLRGYPQLLEELREHVNNEWLASWDDQEITNVIPSRPTQQQQQHSGSL